MYEKFYGLKSKPFQLNPDPRFFYGSRGHQRAMAYLRYGLQQGQGFIVVTGDVGTGKTMLVNNLFRELDQHNIVAAKIVSTNVKEHDLLRLVAADFEIEFERATKAVLLTRLERFFRTCVDDGKRVLLVIDEAQNLPKPSLEELRMLSNFDYKGQPLVQSFLLGQREFRMTLRSPGFEQVRQRIIAAYHLKPLNLEETQHYILHRLRKVGWKTDPSFEPEVFAGVYKFTKGVPRRINTLMDRLLLNGAIEETHAITTRELGTITKEIDLEQGGGDGDISGPQRGSDDSWDDLQPGTTPKQAPAPAPAPQPQGVDVVRIEQRLLQMQQAFDRLSVNMSAPATTAPAPEPQERKFVSPWALAFGAALGVILLFAGALAFYVLSRG